MKHFLLTALLIFSALAGYSANYQNPILYEDYSDPDVIRVGEDYWMTASSFHCWPGLPILHSYDLVHWEVVNNAIQDPIPGGVGETFVEHGNQVWAPSIRFHKGIYYITWGDPDVGIYQIHTFNPLEAWSKPQLIVKAKGYIDACPFWDEDGRTYIVHALARSRAGIKSVLLLTEVDETLTKVLKPSKIFFDGHETQPTCEGPKLYKKYGYYYVFFPAGGVATGWQSVIRSKSLDVWSDNFNPSDWEEKIVMNQGSTNVNGPHQGGWVTTPSGEDWFIHFQDVGPLGRILHLQPMKWLSDGWPVIGIDTDADGVGQPVLKYTVPAVSKAQQTLIKKNRKIRVGYCSWQPDNILEWQWQSAAANENVQWWQHGMMFCRQAADNNIWKEPHMLLKKIQGPDVQYTAQVLFTPKEMGDRIGLCVLGKAYAGLDMVKEEEEGKVSLRFFQNTKAEKNDQNTVVPLRTLTSSKDEYTVFMRVTVHSADALPDQGNDDKRVSATFAYSMDGKHFTEVEGYALDVQPGKWIGAKVGFFAQAIGDDGSRGKAFILSFEEKPL